MEGNNEMEEIQKLNDSVNIPDEAKESDEDEDSNYEDDSEYETDDGEQVEDEMTWEYLNTLAHQERELKRNINDEKLPSTVSLLTSENGAKVYLIGTAHFSTESCNEVELLIEQAQPDIVVVELCRARSGMLSVDKKTLNEKASENVWNKAGEYIREKGVMAGLMTVLMMQVSVQITKQLGMPPGGEFVAAGKASRKVPGCYMILGDRDISVTLKRAFGVLTWFDKIKLFASICKDFNIKITEEEIEKLKEKDMLEQALGEMVKSHPKVTNVFCHERDIYLAYSIQQQTKQIFNEQPPVIVAVVGIGHRQGIIDNFNKVITREEMKEIVHIPERSKISFVVTTAIKISVVGALAYGMFQFGKFCVSFVY